MTLAVRASDLHNGTAAPPDCGVARSVRRLVAITAVRIWTVSGGYNRKCLSRAHTLPPIIGATIGLSLSIVAWFVVAHLEDRLAANEFKQRAVNHVSLLQSG